jgi:methanethiol oxidase
VGPPRAAAKEVLDVPGAPLEIRCAWGARNNYCFTSTALTSKIWLIYEDDRRRVARQGRGRHRRRSEDPAARRHLHFGRRHAVVGDTWNDGMTRLFDISNPHAPTQVMEKTIGEQVNMVSQSWDGKRLYYTSSLLANWDKTESTGGDLQYFKLYEWDGKALTPKFHVDFLAEGLGAPHQMRFGAYALYGKQRPVQASGAPAR